MNELELIEQLTRKLPKGSSTVTGPGDDCAVLDLGLKDEFVLFKTDAVVESIHFTLADAPEKVGHKAMARCLSDVAAMGGAPKSCLVTLALPRKFEADYIQQLMAGIAGTAQRYGADVSGGETTANAGGILVSVALLGTVPRSRCILRSGARPGDAIFVTGELGGSISGWHLEFEPRIEQGQWLTSHFTVHAMIDVSDGIATDLRHIITASGVGAELHGKAIPISRAARSQARAESKPPLLAALTDGEDFELLFTVRSLDAVSLLDAWKARFPKLRLSCIGKIVAGSSLKLHDQHGVRELRARGYVHFD